MKAKGRRLWGLILDTSYESRPDAGEMRKFLHRIVKATGNSNVKFRVVALTEVARPKVSP